MARCICKDLEDHHSEEPPYPCLVEDCRCEAFEDPDNFDYPGFDFMESDQRGP